MAVRIQKSAVNIREKLAELERPVGITGAALMKAETPQEAYNLVGSSRKNIIINGSMVVNQRGWTGAAGTTTHQAYTTDRFYLDQSHDGAVSAGQTSMNSTIGGNAYADGFRNALIFRVTTADTSLAGGQYQAINQVVEGYNLQGIKKGTANAQPVTLSFWVRGTTTGTYIVELYDNDNARQVSQAYTINTANTWEKKVLTFPADTTGAFDNDNNASLYVTWWLAAGSNLSSGTLNTSWAASTSANRVVGQVNAIGTVGDFWLTGVQLEVGKFATEFERRSYGQELELCQRYYEKSFEDSTVPAQGASSTAFSTEIGLTSGWSGHRAMYPAGGYPGRSVFTRFRVPKRAAPSVTLYGNNAGYPYLYDSTNGARWVTANWGTSSNKEGFEHQNEFSSNNFQLFAFCHWTASAEL